MCKYFARQVKENCNEDNHLLLQAKDYGKQAYSTCTEFNPTIGRAYAIVLGNYIKHFRPSPMDKDKLELEILINNLQSQSLENTGSEQNNKWQTVQDAIKYCPGRLDPDRWNQTEECKQIICSSHCQNYISNRISNYDDQYNVWRVTDNLLFNKKYLCIYNNKLRLEQFYFRSLVQGLSVFSN